MRKHKYKLTATISGEIEYATPQEWQKALDTVAAKVAQLKALGAEVKQKPEPVK